MPKYIDRPVRIEELNALRALALTEEQRFFKDNPALVAPYRSRLLIVALCQGAAQQFIGRGYGVKDFDVHFFYAQNPAKPRLSRTVKAVIADVGSFRGIKVDFIRTVVPWGSTVGLTSDKEIVERIRQFLQLGSTANARHLAKKAVICLLPAGLFGQIIWGE